MTCKDYERAEVFQEQSARGPLLLRPPQIPSSIPTLISKRSRVAGHPDLKYQVWNNRGASATGDRWCALTWILSRFFAARSGCRQQHFYIRARKRAEHRLCSTPGGRNCYRRQDGVANSSESKQKPELRSWAAGAGAGLTCRSMAPPRCCCSGHLKRSLIFRSSSKACLECAFVRACGRGSMRPGQAWDKEDQDGATKTGDRRRRRRRRRYSASKAWSLGRLYALRAVLCGLLTEKHPAHLGTTRPYLS